MKQVKTLVFLTGFFLAQWLSLPAQTEIRSRLVIMDKSETSTRCLLKINLSQFPMILQKACFLELIYQHPSLKVMEYNVEHGVVEIYVEKPLTTEFAITEAERLFSRVIDETGTMNDARRKELNIAVRKYQLK